MGRSRRPRTTQPCLSLLLFLLPIDAISALSLSKFQFYPSACPAALRANAPATCESAKDGMRLYPVVSGWSALTTASLRSSRLVATDAEAASEVAANAQATETLTLLRLGLVRTSSAPFNAHSLRSSTLEPPRSGIQYCPSTFIQRA
eukprot:6196868-Pleurochrysis_carterae.AAC.2